MANEYAENKIREALTLHDGNISRARSTILLQSHDDPLLLRALAAPHLDGIIAYQVDRVASGRAEIEKRHPKKSVNKSNKKEENFGMNLLRAVAASDANIFGMDNGIPLKRHGASKQHIEAIHKMVASRHNKKS